MPTVAGSYHLEVFPTEDAPHNGRGGSFRVDLSTGPVGGAPPPPPPPPVPVVHVGDLDGVGTPQGVNRWTATVTITVHDQTHGPRAGVTVSGTWGGKGAGVSCITDAVGRCSLSRQHGKNISVTFSVTGLSLTGSSYDAGANHDPDGDTTGTSVTVTRP
jgi:serine protease AprX